MDAVIQIVFVIILGLYSFQVSCEKEREWLCEDCIPPKHCNTATAKNFSSYETVEDFDRCAPSLLPRYAREYFTFAGRRRVTFRENFLGYRRLRILPKMLRDVSNMDLSVTVLNERISIPIGASPVALQKLASRNGEIDTVRATYEAGTVMILSSYSGTSIEDVAKAAPEAIKWMQTYIFSQREVTINIVRRAEASGYKAIVVTVDSPIETSRPSVVPNPQGVGYSNLKLLGGDKSAANPRLTFADLAWLKKQTKLPIIAKGILSAADAVKAARYGVSGILVSNHGGRQLDSVPATIDVLPSIVRAIRRCCPKVEIYVDGGVRNGLDVFKALARGARAVFVGRPVLWGLAVKGQRGVRKVFDILTTELNETMMLAGTPNVNSIESNMVVENAAYILQNSRDIPMSLESSLESERMESSLESERMESSLESERMES